MKLTNETRDKIADIIYELNVDPTEVDAVVAQIENLLPDMGIVIDMAGAMDKITPAMIDETRDLMIDSLVNRCKQMREALKPFAGKVFNDNGDMTVSDTHTLSVYDYARAYYAHRAEVPKDGAIASLDASATPGQFGLLNGPWQIQEGKQHRSHVSAMQKDGTPYWVASFKHADDAAFVAALVNKYRKGITA